MTSPTQAQIDAAAKALCNLACNAECWHEQETQTEERAHWIGLAKAALTAAAGVEKRTDISSDSSEARCWLELGMRNKQLIEANEKLAALTERCAQVADDYDKEYCGYPTVGAAIRALKD